MSINTLYKESLRERIEEIEKELKKNCIILLPLSFFEELEKQYSIKIYHNRNEWTARIGALETYQELLKRVI